MLRYLTAGESHGQALLVIIDGIPAGLPLKSEIIDRELARRQKGYGRGGRMKIEQDRAEIFSGVRAGKTLGSPIGIKIPNKDWSNWQKIMSAEGGSASGGDVAGEDPSSRVVHCPRPGHADLAGGLKYNHHDLRNVLERASARETAARVAAGAICRYLLREFQIEIAGHVIQLGGIETSPVRPPLSRLSRMAEESKLRCIDRNAEKKMILRIDQAKKKGDSLGGVLEVIVAGLPVGLGSHVQWDRKLDGRLAQAVMSIQAIKGVELGLGFQSASEFGSAVHDEIFYTKKKGFFRKTNRAGGLEGGITNGEPLILRAAMKPLSTLMRPLHSVHILSKRPHLATVERSDVTAVPAASVIAENVVALTLAQAFLEKFGGDSLGEIWRNYQGYLRQVKSF